MFIALHFYSNLKQNTCHDDGKTLAVILAAISQNNFVYSSKIFIRNVLLIFSLGKRHTCKNYLPTENAKNLQMFITLHFYSKLKQNTFSATGSESVKVLPTAFHQMLSAEVHQCTQEILALKVCTVNLSARLDSLSKTLQQVLHHEQKQQHHQNSPKEKVYTHFTEHKQTVLSLL